MCIWNPEGIGGAPAICRSRFSLRESANGWRLDDFDSLRDNERKRLVFESLVGFDVQEVEDRSVSVFLLDRNLLDQVRRGSHLDLNVGVQLPIFGDQVQPIRSMR